VLSPYPVNIHGIRLTLSKGLPSSDLFLYNPTASITVQEIHDAIANRDWTVRSSGRKYATFLLTMILRENCIQSHAVCPSSRRAQPGHAIVWYILQRFSNFPDVSLYVFFFGNTPWCWDLHGSEMVSEQCQ